MTILRIELRRSWALWTVVVIGGLGTVMYYVGANLGGGWTGLALQERAMIGVLFAMGAGAGAGQGLRDRRSRMDELIATTPRPRRHRVLPGAVAMALAAAVAYLVIFAAGAVHLVPVATYFPPGSLAIVAVGVLSMVAAVLIGLGVGTRFPSTLTPPLLGIACVAVLFAFPAFVLGVRFGADPSGAALLSPQLQPTNGFTAEFVTVPALTHVAQLVWFGAVALSGLLLLAAAGRGTRLAAVLPAVLGAAVVLPLLPDKLSGAFTVDPGATAPVCTADAPRVCVTRVHEAVLADLVGPGRAALALMAARLPDPPTSIMEDFANPIDADPKRQRADTVLAAVRVTEDGRAFYGPDHTLWQLLSGAGAQPCLALLRRADDGGTAYLSARLAVAQWLAGRPPPGTDNPAVRSTVDTLTAMPLAEQRARVAAFRAAELTCAPGDRLAILVGPR